ncbi:MAG TPA: protein kinase [Myxococcales bacterium]|nr:protein kinase [Myxococcales bacterium]
MNKTGAEPAEPQSAPIQPDQPGAGPGAVPRGTTPAIAGTAPSQPARDVAAPPSIIADRYTIDRELGQGGMGRVFLAHDRKLGRSVALKVLTPGAHSEEDLQRFEQEARAAGSINHPNILAVYDIGSHDGGPYIVSELLEGGTLRHRMAGKPMPWKRVVDIGVQIAQGLSTAHSKGVIHRDLKPENVFVCSDGRVKILDFGIAKLIERSKPGDSAAKKPHTLTGTIMGTIGYMSPEQVRGEPTDARSDIFSFGSILYEMLSGKPSFDRATPMETAAAILQNEPPDLPDAVPAALERLVRRCLEKQPGDRYQAAHEIAFELATIPSTTTGPGGLPLRRSPMRIVRPAVAIVAVLGLGIGVGLGLGRRDRGLPEPHYKLLSTGSERPIEARFAPDGFTAVYTALSGYDSALFTTRIDRPSTQPTGVKDVEIAAISRSGEMLVKLGGIPTNTGTIKSTLARMPLGGTAPREVLEQVDSADWMPDGTTFAVVRHAGGAQQLEFPLGTKVLESTGAIGNIRVSPDGKWVAFLDQRYAPDDRGWIAVVDRKGQKRVLTGEYSTLQGLAWSPSGNEVWYGASERSFDSGIHAVTLAGDHRLLAQAPGNLKVMDVARDGRMLVRFMRQQFLTRCYGPGDKVEKDCNALDRSHPIALSRDGKSLLLSEENEGEGPFYGTYLRRTDGSPAVRLGEGAASSLSQDGKWAFSLIFGDDPHVMMYPTGAGEPRRISIDARYHVEFAGLMPDGKTLLIGAKEQGQSFRAYLRPLDGTEMRPVPGTSSQFDATLSPDGKWMALFLEDGKLHLRAFGSEKDERAFEFKHGKVTESGFAGWAHDGSSVYIQTGYRTPEVRVYRMDLKTGKTDLWRSLPNNENMRINGTIAADDGVAFAYNGLRLQMLLYLLEGAR